MSFLYALQKRKKNIEQKENDRQDEQGVNLTTLKVLNFAGIKFGNFRDFQPFWRNFILTKNFETTKSRS